MEIWTRSRIHVRTGFLSRLQTARSEVSRTILPVTLASPRGLHVHHNMYVVTEKNTPKILGPKCLVLLGPKCPDTSDLGPKCLLDTSDLGRKC